MKIENVETLFVMTPAFAALLKTAETYIRLRKSPYITITEESIAKTQNDSRPMSRKTLLSLLLIGIAFFTTAPAVAGDNKVEQVGAYADPAASEAAKQIASATSRAVPSRGTG